MQVNLNLSELERMVKALDYDASDKGKALHARLRRYRDKLHEREQTKAQYDKTT